MCKDPGEFDDYSIFETAGLVCIQWSVSTKRGPGKDNWGTVDSVMGTQGPPIQLVSKDHWDQFNRRATVAQTTDKVHAGYDREVSEHTLV